MCQCGLERLKEHRGERWGPPLAKGIVSQWSLVATARSRTVVGEVRERTNGPRMGGPLGDLSGVTVRPVSCNKNPLLVVPGGELSRSYGIVKRLLVSSFKLYLSPLPRKGSHRTPLAREGALSGDLTNLVYILFIPCNPPPSMPILERESDLT